MKITTKLKMDLSGMEKLRKKLRTTSVDAGWLHEVNHWNSDPKNPITVPTLAAHLHYNSEWEDSFMLSYKRNMEVNTIVQINLNKYLGILDIPVIADRIGADMAKRIKVNIEDVSSPANNTNWASIKGFNDPLIYGSASGKTPNLLSEINWEVK